MSDEPSSSTAASSANPNDADVSTRPGIVPAEDELKARRKRNSQMVSRKRSELLSDLLTGVDVLVYAELSVVYYME